MISNRVAAIGPGYGEDRRALTPGRRGSRGPTVGRPYAPGVPELRRDQLTGEVVLLAPGRAARPHTVRGAVPGSNEARRCPFCPGHEADTPPEVARVGAGPPDGPGWRVRAFPNLYPIVGGTEGRSGATGDHEVVVLSPDHLRDLGGLDDDQTIDVFGVLRDRSRAHAQAGHAYVQIAVNRGREAGASIEHPHAQVLALDFVPPAVEAAVSRFQAVGTDLVADDQVRAEADGGLVLRRGEAGAWCGPSSAAPYEVRVAARGGGARYAAAPDAALIDTALAVRDCVRRLNHLLDAPPYNVVVHDGPRGGDERYHWWVTVLPRLSVPAGFELGTGVLVETVDPRDAAEQLRAVATP
jgi:UDPglucose--hexose-1-phosphate uridylyltransferase